MSRGEANEVEGWVPSRGVQIPWKTFQKDLEKPLDKRHKMCYNNNVKGAVSLAKVWVAIAKQTTTEKIFQKVLKNPLTKTKKYDIIYT